MQVSLDRLVCWRCAYPVAGFDVCPECGACNRHLLVNGAANARAGDWLRAQLFALRVFRFCAVAVICLAVSVYILSAVPAGIDAYLFMLGVISAVFLGLLLRAGIHNWVNVGSRFVAGIGLPSAVLSVVLLVWFSSRAILQGSLGSQGSVAGDLLMFTVVAMSMSVLVLASLRRIEETFQAGLQDWSPLLSIQIGFACVVAWLLSFVGCMLAIYVFVFLFPSILVSIWLATMRLERLYRTLDAAAPLADHRSA